jgi:small subunit ribosomal protein S17
MENKRKTRTGKIISNKMDKSVVVMVESPKRHPLYKKIIKHKAKFMAHDETNSCQVGDVVKIIETRPLSKTKRWDVLEIVTKKETVEIKPEEVT